MADDIGDALDVDVNDVGKFLRADAPQRGVAIDDAGVVQQQVRRAVGVQEPVGPGLHLRVLRDVHALEIVRFAEQLDHLPGGVLGPAAAEDRVAEAREFIRHRAAQPARHAGDEDDFGLSSAHETRQANPFEADSASGIFYLRIGGANSVSSKLPRFANLSCVCPPKAGETFGSLTSPAAEISSSRRVASTVCALPR